MRKGDLVTLKESEKTAGIDYGIGIVLEVRYVSTVIVQWLHEVQWCDLDDLVVFSSLDA